MDPEREEELESLEQYRKGLQPAPILYRADGIKLETKPGEAMTFVASEESPDRMGDVVTASGWQLDNFKKNPVFLYMHNPNFPPIGIWDAVRVEEKQLLASPRWDDGDDFAKLIRGKYERGIMRAVSVGFRVYTFEAISPSEKQPKEGMLFKSQELLEISAVTVPAHPKTLRRALGIRSHFWIPFQADGERHVTEMRKQLVALKDELEQVITNLHVDDPGMPVDDPARLDWDEVLAKINHLGKS